MYKKYQRGKVSIGGSSVNTSGEGNAYVSRASRASNAGLDITGNIEMQLANHREETPPFDPLRKDSKVNAAVAIPKKKEAICKYCNKTLFISIASILIILVLIGIIIVNDDNFCNQKDNNYDANEYSNTLWCKMAKAYLSVILAGIGIVSLASLWCCYKCFVV